MQSRNSPLTADLRHISFEEAYFSNNHSHCYSATKRAETASAVTEHFKLSTVGQQSTARLSMVCFTAVKSLVFTVERYDRL